MVSNVLSQIPNGYYDNAQGLDSIILKTALYNIIKDHTERTYTNLWTDFQSTDKKDNGYVWDYYSKEMQWAREQFETYFINKENLK